MSHLPEVNPQDVEDGWRLRRLAWGHLPPLAFQAACRHDVFTQLESLGGASPARLAERLDLNADALALLLECMAALELLEVTEGVYRNAPISSRMLVKGQPLCQLDIILRKQVNAGTVEHSEEVLRLGHRPSPAVPRGDLRDVLSATSQSTLLSVARVVELAPARAGEVLLGVAEAPGTYSIAYAASAPDLRAIILELPQVVPSVRQFLEGSGVEDRIEVVAGDMFNCELPTGVTTVLLSNVVHFVDEAHIDSLIERLAGCLPSGGRMLIKDGFREDGGRGPLIQSVLALLLMSLSPGISFTLGRIQGSLHKAGMTVEQVLDMAPEPAHLLVAYKR